MTLSILKVFQALKGIIKPLLQLVTSFILLLLIVFLLPRVAVTVLPWRPSRQVRYPRVS